MAIPDLSNKFKKRIYVVKQTPQDELAELVRDGHILVRYEDNKMVAVYGKGPGAEWFEKQGVPLATVIQPNRRSTKRGAAPDIVKTPVDGVIALLGDKCIAELQKAQPWVHGSAETTDKHTQTVSFAEMFDTIKDAEAGWIKQHTGMPGR